MAASWLGGCNVFKIITVLFTQNVILRSLRGNRHITTSGVRVATPTNRFDCLLHSIVVTMTFHSRHGTVMCVFSVFMVFCVSLCDGMHSTCDVRICSPRIPTIGLSRKIQKQKVALENTSFKKNSRGTEIGKSR